MSSEERGSVRPEDNLGLEQILQVRVSQERVDRLKRLTSVDVPRGVSDEVFEFLVRQQAEWVNM